MKTMRVGRQRVRSRSPFQRRRKAHELLTDVQRLEEEYYLSQLNSSRSLSPGQRIRRDELIAAMEMAENKPRSCLRAPFRFNRSSSPILLTPSLNDIKEIDGDNNTQPTPSTAAHEDEEEEESEGENLALQEREFSRVTSVATGAGDSPVEVVLAPPPPSKPSPKRLVEKEGERPKSVGASATAESKSQNQSATSTAGPLSPDHSASKSSAAEKQPQQQVLLQHRQYKPPQKRKTLRKLFMKSRSDSSLGDKFSTPPRFSDDGKGSSRGRARVRDELRARPEQDGTPTADPKSAKSPRGIRIYPPIVTPGGTKNRGNGRPIHPRTANRLEESAKKFDGIMEKEQKAKYRTPSSIQLTRKPSHVSEISTPAALLHSRVKSFGDDSVAEIRRALRQVESQLSTTDRGSIKDARELILHALSKVAASLESAEDRKLLNKQLRELQDASLDSYDSELDSEDDNTYGESDLLMLCGPDGIMNNNKTNAYRNRMKRNRDLKYHLADDRVSESDRSVSDGSTTESSAGSILNETRSFNEWFEELEGPYARQENKSIAEMLGLSSFFSADEELDKEWSAFTNDRNRGYHAVGIGAGIGQTFSSGFGPSFGLGDRVEDPLDSPRHERKSPVEKEARHSDYSSHESSETSSGSTESSNHEEHEPVRGQRSWWKPASSDGNRGEAASPKVAVTEQNAHTTRNVATSFAAPPASPPSHDELSLSSIESDMYGKSNTGMMKVKPKEPWDSPYNAMYVTDESNAFLQFEQDGADNHRLRQQWSPPRQRNSRRGLSPRNLWTRRGEQEEFGR